MSPLFKANLEEYARQCTLQRRRYEECLQQTQQSHMVDTAEALVGAIEDVAREPAGARQVDACSEQAVESCMIELLEMPVELLEWGDENFVLDEPRSVFVEEQKWHSDHAQVSQQTVVNYTKNSPSSVGFGAP